MVENPPAGKEIQVQSLSREDPLEKGTATKDLCGPLQVKNYFGGKTENLTLFMYTAQISTQYINRWIAYLWRQVIREKMSTKTP